MQLCLFQEISTSCEAQSSSHPRESLTAERASEEAARKPSDETSRVKGASHHHLLEEQISLRSERWDTPPILCLWHVWAEVCERCRVSVCFHVMALGGALIEQRKVVQVPSAGLLDIQPAAHRCFRDAMSVCRVLM